MSPAQRQHATQVAALADQYRQQGYVVSVPADREAVPFDLQGYLPDLLAVKEQQHLLLLVNDGHGAVSVSRLQQLVETAKQHPGWRVLLVNDAPESQGQGILQDPISWASITQRADQARQLRETGASEAAILLLWTAFEALLRRHAESLDMPLGHSSVRALLDYLYSDADLSYEQFEEAQRLLVGRNQLAHGFPLAEASQQATRLQTLLDELSGEWLPTRQAA